MPLDISNVNDLFTELELRDTAFSAEVQSALAGAAAVEQAKHEEQLTSQDSDR